MQMIDDRRRDRLAGLLLVAVGLTAAYVAKSYEIGSLTHIGPGFFPMVLSTILAGLGVAIFLMPSNTTPAPVLGTPLGHGRATGSAFDIRGWGCIIGAVILFTALADQAGLLPATFACVFVGAMGDRKSTLIGSLILATCVSIFGILLFSYVLRVQIPVLKGF